MHKIMIVEDDPKLASLMSTSLAKYGFHPVVIEQFDRVLDQFNAHRPDMVLLDVNLPSYDGYYWCRQIRSVSTCPVLFISARAGEMDQVMALENGGDDYITKPFHNEIAMAKVRSLLRRAYGEYATGRERFASWEGLSIFPERLELELGGRNVMVTKKEADILELLIKRAPRIASRDELLERLWDDQMFVDENTLNVNMARVRKKLQELGVQDGIETVRGSGYRLVASWSGSGGER